MDGVQECLQRKDKKLSETEEKKAEKNLVFNAQSIKSI